MPAPRRTGTPARLTSRRFSEWVGAAGAGAGVGESTGALAVTGDETTLFVIGLQVKQISHVHGSQNQRSPTTPLCPQTLELSQNQPFSLYCPGNWEEMIIRWPPVKHKGGSST